MQQNNRLLKFAGITLILNASAFIAVFSYLAAVFGYPDVLDHDAAQVLPLLAEGGSSLRNVWFLYGALPFGLVLAGAAVGPWLGRAGPVYRAVGVSASVTGGIAMSLGLLRWPTLEWTLAEHWLAEPAARYALSAMFDASNLFLGNLVGEFVGELGVGTWFVVLGLAHRKLGQRLFGNLGIFAGVLMLVAALRNITSVVALVSELNNLTLPLWLITLGVLFFRERSVAAS
jgi:hypothetical protein